MPRARDLTTPRPKCPDGHDGEVWLDGFYGRDKTHQRPLFRCVPNNPDPHRSPRPKLHADGKPAHKFVEPLPRRHTRTTSAPAACEECEHVLTRREGPQTPRNCVFTVREVAKMLVALTHGRSMRKAAKDMRESADRTVLSLWGQQRPSLYGQLSADYVAALGQAVVSELMPAHWPDAVALDETTFPFVLTERDDKGKVVSQRTMEFSLLGVMGYDAGAGKGLPWRFAVRGGYDTVEWEAVLRSLPGAPTWVVCDERKSIRAAVRRVWPKATIYSCEAHIARLGEKKLGLDGHGPYSDLWWKLQRGVKNEVAWQAFEQEARAKGAANTFRWIASKRRTMKRQFAVSEEGRPRSTGSLETTLREMKERLGLRRYVVRNRVRLDLLFALMALDLREEASERSFARVLRRLVEANKGNLVLGRRSLDDKGGSSLHAAVIDVEARLAPQRAKNRQHAAAARSRQAVAAVGSAPLPKTA